jgi:dolichol-phosphate mannosyltransferase
VAAELTVLTLTLNEEHALPGFLEKCLPTISKVVGDFELLIIDGNSTDRTVEIARAAGARIENQSKPGYGNAYREGLSLASGKYILTLDADSAHPMDLFADFWKERERHSLVMGSRYLRGAGDGRSFPRRILSNVLNFAYRLLLWSPMTDISGGFRLYRAEDVRRVDSRAPYYDVVAEIAVLMHGMGMKVLEIPYQYIPRDDDESKAQIIKFGISYGKTLLRLVWWLRAGGAAAARKAAQC